MLERHTHKALRCQVVHLGRLGCLQQANAGGKVGQVVFHQMQVGVALDTKLFDAPEIDGTGAAVGAIDLVALI
ncbi:hypothetical protein D3C72_2166990 [compost metagenome]